MACGSCRSLAALSQVYGPDAARYVRCLLRALGRPESPGKWDAAAHDALYAAAASSAFLRGEQTPEAMRAEGLGSNPQRAAEIAVNYPTLGLGSGDAFWTCLGIGQADAVASWAARVGAYWNIALVAGRMIADAEGGGRKGRRRGSLAASVVVTGLGMIGLGLLGDR